MGAPRKYPDELRERAVRLAVEARATLAATPGVTGIEASIPQTMRVDYGPLTVGVSPADDATLARVHQVIEGTAFARTTLHGSFGNGAKS